MRRRMYTLDYPNDEVRRGFVSLMANSYFHTKEVDNENWIIQIDDMLRDFSYTFYIINRLLGCYTTLIEKQNSKGRADIIIETDNDIFIFEFKLDKSAAEALEQIEEQQYALPYQNGKRKVHKIGVNISSASRTVDEWVVVD